MGNSPVELLDRARRFVSEELWAEDLGPRRVSAALLRSLQLVVVIARSFVSDRLLLRASALTYMTSLAIVPLLVMLLSVIQWLGLSRDLAMLAVDQLLAGSPGAVDQIMAVVDEANVGALGSLGGAVLLVTTVLSLRHVEETFNDIWGARSSRSWMRRFTNYLAVLVVVPLLLGIAISLVPTLRSGAIVDLLLAQPFFAVVGQVALRAAPTFFLFLGFSMLYWLLPNTPVKPVSALLGGVVAALLFTGAQNAYVGFAVGAARYDAVFGGFSILPLLLVWIYISWSIVLMGAEVAYAHQHLASYREEARERDVAPAERESMALRVTLDVARCFRDRSQPQSLDVIAVQLGASLRTAAALLDRLQAGGIVSLCTGPEGDIRYQLGRPADDIRVGEILEAIRGSRWPLPGGSRAEDGGRPADRVVDSLLREAATARASIDAQSLADLLAGVPRETQPPSLRAGPR